MSYEIRDINLAPSGEHKIDWVRKNCPLLRSLEEDFSKEKPFEGIRIALSIHLEAKTAYLCKVLAAGGAEMYITGSNPLSTQDDVAAALVKAGLNVFAWYGSTEEEYSHHITKVLENNCNIIIDDGRQDFFYDVNMALHQALTNKGIAHNFTIRPGQHSWKYWKESLPQHLAFFKQAFDGKPVVCKTTIDNSQPAKAPAPKATEKPAKKAKEKAK